MFNIGADTSVFMTHPCVPASVSSTNDTAPSFANATTCTSTTTCANVPTSVSSTNDTAPSFANATTSTSTTTCANVPASVSSANDTAAVSTAVSASGTTNFPPHSSHKLILISNNPQWLQVPSLENYLTLQYMETQAFDVLITVRDYIHAGSRLLNHPLYGNFRPYQQPFRSLIVEASKTPSMDTLSLHLIEQAQNIYNDCAHQILDIATLHPKLLHDCAFLDRALLDATLEHCCHSSFLTTTSYKE